MNTSPSKYPYVLAIIFGLLVPFIGDIEPFPFPLALMYFFGGGLFGFLWPKVSWRWGFWIVGPMIGLIGLSVLFAGQLEVFLKKDLPILVVAITSACLGSFISAWFKHRRRKATE
jgi:hypothetical protein